jgi:two-component system OmpR family response regulator
MGRKLILCIDNRATQAEVRKLLLECEGHRVLMASNGRAGVTLFAIHSVDLVLLDYDTPQLNAAGVIAKMRDLKPNVPIVMISHRRRPPEGMQCLVDAYVSKGQHPCVLLERIRALLTRA